MVVPGGLKKRRLNSEQCSDGDTPPTCLHKYLAPPISDSLIDHQAHHCEVELCVIWHLCRLHLEQRSYAEVDDEFCQRNRKSCWNLGVSADVGDLLAFCLVPLQSHHGPGSKTALSLMTPRYSVQEYVVGLASLLLGDTWKITVDLKFREEGNQTEVVTTALSPSSVSSSKMPKTKNLQDESARPLKRCDYPFASPQLRGPQGRLLAGISVRVPEKNGDDVKLDYDRVPIKIASVIQTRGTKRESEANRAQCRDGWEQV